MASCKDCIHRELCNVHGYIDADECGVFKNKADVVEVKHGTWKLFDDGSGRCDQCGKIQRDVWDIENVQNYCCHCGAKMDGGKKE